MYLALDMGTSATKAVVVDDQQRPVAHGEARYATHHPQPGWSEQDPALWITAIASALAGMDRAVLASVQAIGLSGQMHSLVALDAAHNPILPALLWNDARGAAQCHALTHAVPRLGQITGVIAMASFTAAKLLWLREERPEAFHRLRHVLLPKDYLRLYLTGTLASDMSDAGGSQLFDQAHRQWSPEVAAAIGLALDCLPPLLEGSAIAATLRPTVASALGLPAGIPVAAGGGDAATGALGVGCIGTGIGFITLGTGTSVIIGQDRYDPHPERVLHSFAHAIPDRWYTMAAMLNGASALAWLAGIMGERDITALLARLEARYHGPSSVLFLPYLAGERTPHNNPTATASFLGLTSRHDGLDMAQAVLEGVAFSLRDAANALAAAGGLPDRLGFIGGGSRSPLWGRIIASALDRPLVVYEGAALGPALGAARLAIMAATGAPAAEVAPPPAVNTVIMPQAGLVAGYAESHTRFAAAYGVTAYRATAYRAAASGTFRAV